MKESLHKRTFDLISRSSRNHFYDPVNEVFVKLFLSLYSCVHFLLKIVFCFWSYVLDVHDRNYDHVSTYTLYIVHLNVIPKSD